MEGGGRASVVAPSMPDWHTSYVTDFFVLTHLVVWFPYFINIHHKLVFSIHVVKSYFKSKLVIKIRTAVTGWGKFQHLLHILACLGETRPQNSPDLSWRFGSVVGNSKVINI